MGDQLDCLKQRIDWNQASLAHQSKNKAAAQNDQNQVWLTNAIFGEVFFYLFGLLGRKRDFDFETVLDRFTGRCKDEKISVPESNIQVIDRVFWNFCRVLKIQLDLHPIRSEVNDSPVEFSVALFVSVWIYYFQFESRFNNEVNRTCVC